jgi:hypothetical protein
MFFSGVEGVQVRQSLDEFDPIYGSEITLVKGWAHGLPVEYIKYGSSVSVSCCNNDNSGLRGGG